MKLYGFPLSPFVRKVAVVLADKGLDFEWVPTNPRQPDEEFSAASPFHKIPALADGDFRIADSTAIVTYLDAAYPQAQTLPTEAKARARAVWFEEVADTIMVAAGSPIIYNRFLQPVIFGQAGDEAAAQAAEQALLRPLDYIEGQLGEEGWLGDDFTIGDLSIAAPIKTLSYAGWTIDAARHPKLATWYDRVQARPGWQAVAEREAATFAALSGH